MVDHKGLPVLAFPSREHWDAWLDEHAAHSSGVWLKFAKESSGAASVSKAESIEAALAHGWIDGQLDRFDDQFWLTRFTPRGSRSKWSQKNRDTATRLIAEGRVQARGMAEIEKAKNDGRWEAAYAPQSAVTVPTDLQSALDKHPKAKAFFETLRGANRYAILYRIHDAKTTKTRLARIEKFISMLALGQTVHPSIRAHRSGRRAAD
jgi:uncharacterized protein YdeI (YjbR/CyaY-like superfamily)